jgi:hypothetical protein
MYPNDLQRNRGRPRPNDEDIMSLQDDEASDDDVDRFFGNWIVQLEDDDGISGSSDDVGSGGEDLSDDDDVEDAEDSDGAVGPRWDAADPYSPIHMLPTHPHPQSCLDTLQAIQYGLFSRPCLMSVSMELLGRTARAMHLPDHWRRTSVHYASTDDPNDNWLIRRERLDLPLITLRHYLLLRTDPEVAEQVMSTRYWSRPEILVRSNANGSALILAIWVPQLLDTTPSLRGGITIDNIPSNWDGAAFYPPLAVVPSHGGAPSTEAAEEEWEAAIIQRAGALATAFLQAAMQGADV